MNQNQPNELIKSIEEMAEVSKSLLHFLDEQNEIERCFQVLIQQINESQILQNKYKMIEFLNLIVSIIQNHHRDISFFPKVQRIFKTIIQNIKHLCKNSELFNIFIKNKRILLFFLDEKIITLDSILANQMMQMGTHYVEYFYLELEQFIRQKKKAEMKFEIQDQQLFKQLREMGENDSYIANLIRNDNLEMFQSCIDQPEYSVNDKIPLSFFESNPFLLSHKATLIEYAAFFGSINIFNYLLENNALKSPEAWLYAIHGKNMDIIKSLERCFVIPKEFHKSCLLESIRCHHNDIAELILHNHPEIHLDDEALSVCFESHNYSAIRSHFDLDPSKYNELFVIAFKYDYYLILEELIKANSFDMNNRIILFL